MKGAQAGVILTCLLQGHASINDLYDIRSSQKFIYEIGRYQWDLAVNYYQCQNGTSAF